tara:strand:- start:58 stop:588 length:531 start_codon:yes stop_codon:yes gene_type:complete
MVSRSFGNPINNLTDLEQAISLYAVRACEKMRSQSSRAQTVYTFLRTNSFSKKNKQYSAGIMSGFSNPCSDTGHILNLVKKNLSHIYKKGYLYHKGGVMLVDLVPNNIHQRNLFEKYDYQRSDSRMIALDRINQKFGPGTLFYAAAGLKKDGDWQSRTHHLSPRYTTKWGELPHVY